MGRGGGGITLPGERFQLDTIDNEGTVSLKKCNFDDTFNVDSDGNVETTKVEYKSFIDTFTKDSRDAFEAAKFPVDSALKNPKWHVHECKSMIGVALGVLNRNIGNVNVICRSKPKKGVVAGENFATGKMILVPMSLNIKCETEGSDDVKSALICSGAAPYGHVMVLSAPPSDIPCPVWYMGDTDDKTRANMEIRKRKVTIGVRVGTASQKAQFDNTTIDIPVYVNTSPIEKGGEAVYYKPPKEKNSQAYVFDAWRWRWWRG